MLTIGLFQKSRLHTIELIMAFLSDVSSLLRDLQSGGQGDQQHLPDGSHNRSSRPSIAINSGNISYIEPNLGTLFKT